MKYIIVDLEATCWEKREGQPNEIIEIGAVCVDDQKEVRGEFVEIVKPLQHPVLSDFCVQLTSITQDMVNTGLPFPEALEKYLEWIRGFEDEYFLCSWGFYDKKQFAQDCQLHGLATDWLENHISLKHQYAQIKTLKRPIGMANALKAEGIALEGTHHRGIDDAKNIAKIFVKYFEHWEL